MTGKPVMNASGELTQQVGLGMILVSAEASTGISWPGTRPDRLTGKQPIPTFGASVPGYARWTSHTSFGAALNVGCHRHGPRVRYYTIN